MGMNLASAGTQVGMSQSEIMALATALSSVGLEAQARWYSFFESNGKYAIGSRKRWR